MSSDRDAGRLSGGFHSYADDSPRDDAPSEPPLAAGWADIPAWRQMDLPEPEPAAWSRAAVVTGGLAALAIAGVLAWSVQRSGSPPAETSRPPPAAEEAQPLEIVVADPPPPPPPVASAERLEVMPGPASTPAHSPVEVRPPTPLAQVVIPNGPPATPAARTPSAPATAVDASARATAVSRRFDDCDYAPTRAYAMVCRDMGLARADQRMKRAYQAALAAGVPPDLLRRDQDDWMEVREDAAQVSRQAVADIYRQRTRELLAMAADRRD